MNKLTHDYLCVSIGVNGNPLYLQYVSPILKRNRNIILNAVRRNGKVQLRPLIMHLTN
jgi:Domain of unknown function (DUF4116)